MSLSGASLFESQLERSWPPAAWRDTHIVLGVSAGPDSVAMLRAAVAIKHRAGGSGRLHVAHLNHALRGEDGNDDQLWLDALCRQLEIPLEIGQADVAAIAARQGDGIESAAREARYEFLRHVAERLGARFVATAHTADDQVETVLHRIVRGTGLGGLAGIPCVRALAPSVTLVRPMLGMRRSDVLAYLTALGQDYRTDASNSDLRFTRNRLRNELLPGLRTHYNDDVDAALLRLSAQADEAQQLIDELAAELASRCVSMAPGRVRIDRRPLLGQPPLLVREVCKQAWEEAGWPRQAMGFAHWQQLADLVLVESNESHSPTINLPHGIQARRETDAVVLESPRRTAMSQ